MKKIILIGRSECGKTTLTQAMRGETVMYHKTQYVNHYDVIIDTPGEYIQTRTLGGALALYSFEAQVIGLLLSATEPFSLYSPCITGHGYARGGGHYYKDRPSKRACGSGGAMAEAGGMQNDLSCKFPHGRGRRGAD